jgi:phosphoglycolate phosphatase
MDYADKRICVFDFDGTLVDSMGAFADIAADVMEKHYGLEFAPARVRYLETSGIPFFQQLEVIFPGRENNPKLADEFESRKLEGFFAEQYFEDVHDTIEFLHGRGMLAVVSSNNFQYNVDDFMRRRPAAFDHALGFKDGFAKGKDHFEHIMSREEVTPSQMVFVGDSLKDGERALGSDVAFIGRTGTFTREQFLEQYPDIAVIDNLIELKEILSCK